MRLSLPGWLKFRGRSDPAALTAALHPALGNGRNGHARVDYDDDLDDNERRVDYSVPAPVVITVTPQPTQVLSGLMADRLNKLPAQAKKLAQRFRGSFMPLLRQVASMIAAAWREFEAQECGPFSGLRSKLEKDMQSFEPQRLQTAFEDKISEEQRKLDSALKLYMHEQERKAIEAREEISALQEEQAEIESDRRRQIIRMAGDPDIRITPPNTKQEKAGAFLFMLIYGAIEAVAGYAMFKFQGNRWSALATDVVVVGVLTGLVIAGARNLKRAHEHKDAVSRLEQFKRSMRATDDDKDLEVALLSTTTRMLSRYTNLALVAIAVGLFLWRLDTAFSDKQMGSFALTGAFALICASLLFWFYELWTAPKYDHEQYRQLEDLDSQLALNQQMQEERTKIGELDSDRLEAERKKYEAAVSGFVESERSRVPRALSDRTQYLELDRQYLAAYEEAKGHLRILGEIVTDEVEKTRPQDKPHECAPTELEMKELREMFNKLLTSDLHEEEFNGRLLGFRFELDLDPKQAEIPDFDKRVDALHSEVLDEIADSRRVPSVRIPWQED